MNNFYLYLLFFFVGLTNKFDAQRSVIYKNLEEAIQNKEHVYKLNLSRKKLDSLPNNLFLLKNLEYLDLSKNRLDHIPKELKALQNLEHINLSKNNFTDFPEIITELRLLQEIIINNNKITSIPKQIKNLNSLIKLDMWSNELNHIPDEIGLLTSLKEVDFRVIQFSDREKKEYQHYFLMPKYIFQIHVTAEINHSLLLPLL